jgi:hypothetical protein
MADKKERAKVIPFRKRSSRGKAKAAARSISGRPRMVDAIRSSDLASKIADDTGPPTLDFLAGLAKSLCGAMVTMVADSRSLPTSVRERGKSYHAGLAKKRSGKGGDAWLDGRTALIIVNITLGDTIAKLRARGILSPAEAQRLDVVAKSLNAAVERDRAERSEQSETRLAIRMLWAIEKIDAAVAAARSIEAAKEREFARSMAI